MPTTVPFHSDELATLEVVKLRAEVKRLQIQHREDRLSIQVLERNLTGLSERNSASISERDTDFVQLRRNLSQVLPSNHLEPLVLLAGESYDFPRHIRIMLGRVNDIQTVAEDLLSHFSSVQNQESYDAEYIVRGLREMNFHCRASASYGHRALDVAGVRISTLRGVKNPTDSDSDSSSSSDGDVDDDADDSVMS